MGFTVCRFKIFLLSGLFVSASLVLVACGHGGGGGGGRNSSSGSATTSNSRRGIGTLISPPSATGNSMPIVIDAGPVSGSAEINIPYVSVTVCTPGSSVTTSACQTIDHVLLDTSSSGLRLLNSALYSNLNLPPVTNGSGQAIGDCTPFMIGTTWGSVLLADIYVGGEVARSVPIQDIGDTPGGYAAIPSDCKNTGTMTDDQVNLHANGILGVGPFVNDCDACLTAAISATYYTCSAQSCVNASVTQSQVIQNPVALFSQDNNGTLIELPTVPSIGATGSVAGTLIFGIGTESNNGLNGASVYPIDASGNFQTTFNSVVMSNSFIDSGSNGLFFNDTSLATCSNNIWYCPANDPTVLSATNAGATGSPSAVVNFSIDNLDNLAYNAIAANIAGKGSSKAQFDWGLPFFFGRPVFTAISGASTPGGKGPYWAY
ncbi:MAG: DUF3443 family protein [Sulfuricaulis sp.]